MAETALRDIEGLRDDLIRVSNIFFSSRFIAHFIRQTKTNSRCHFAGGRDICIHAHLYATGLLSGRTGSFHLPIGNDELQITFNMSTSPIASFPFTSAELSSDNGILYGINRHNNSLILFDRFPAKRQCRYFCYIGAESYAIKLEIIQY